MTVLRPLSLPLRYGLAVASVSLALLLTMVLPPLSEHGVFMLFLVAVVVGALYGGWGPALFSIVLSLLALDYFFVPPLHAFTVVPLKNLAGLTIFALAALLVATLSVAHRRTESTLRERKEQLKHAQALAHLGSYVLHIPYSQHDQWSDETFRILGLDPAAGTLSQEEYIRRVVYPADQAYVAEVVGKSVKDAQVFDFEYRVERPDGSVRFVHSIGKPVTDRDGKVVKLVGTLQDITERKLAQRALEESKARLALAQEAANVGVWDWDIRTRNLSWSKELYTMFGLEPGSFTLSFENWIEYIHSDDRERIRRAAEQALNEGREFEEEYRIIRPDGQVRWLVGKGRTYKGGDGHPIRMIGIALDITERKTLQQALEESEAKHRAIVDQQTELICRFRPDTVLTFVNGSYCRYFHTTPEQVLGRSALWILPERDHERARLHIASLQAHPRVASCEHEVTTPKGERRWLEWTDQTVMDQRGDVIEIQSIGRDITDRKRAEMTLRQLSGRLLWLQDEERRRIARELHDSTAQSLAGLSMNLTLVQAESDALSDEARKALGESLALAKHSTRELRTLSYLLHPPLLDESGLMSAVRWYADGFSQRSGIRVDLDLPPQPCRFSTEVETALFRIMQECLSNIHKHSGSATASIRIAFDEAQVVMEIRDQGKGMPTPVPGESDVTASSLGVGLMGMRERVRQLHGKVDIASGSWGTAVTVTLPPDGGEPWTHFVS